MSNKSRRRRYFLRWDRYIAKYQMANGLAVVINDGLHRAHNRVENDILSAMKTYPSEIALITYLHKYFNKKR